MTLANTNVYLILVGVPAHSYSPCCATTLTWRQRCSSSLMSLSSHGSTWLVPLRRGCVQRRRGNGLAPANWMATVGAQAVGRSGQPDCGRGGLDEQVLGALSRTTHPL